MQNIRPKTKFENERIHYLRSVVLLLITLCLLLSACLSVYTFFKTKEIIEHKAIFQKHREYTCKQVDGAEETMSTGSTQQLTTNPDLRGSLSQKWSQELNTNPNFLKSDPQSIKFPLNYGYGSVGNTKGLFTFDRLNHTLGIFLDVKDSTGVQANWYMGYIQVSQDKSYVFDTSFRLEKAKASIVAEEVDADNTSTYTDLSIVEPSPETINEAHVFMPKPDTVKLRFYTLLTGSGSVTIFKENVHSVDDKNGISLDEPLASLSFDDGWESVFTSAKPVLDVLGVKSTQYIIAESFRSFFSGYMSLGQVKQLEDEGHEIGSHTLRHCNLANLSLQNAAYDLKYSKKALETEFKPIAGLAYPYGAYDSSINQLAAQNYSYVRTSDNGYDSLLMDRYRLRAVTVVPEMTMEQFKEIVDFAASHKLWLNLVYHRIENSSEAYGTSAALMKQQISYVQSTGLKVVTVEDAVGTILKQQENAYGHKD